MATHLDIRENPQDIALAGVSWAYYEQTLKEVGGQNVRLAFLDGVLRSCLPYRSMKVRPMRSLI